MVGTGMISRVLVLRVLGWSLFYSVVTAIPSTILFTILAVLYSISRDLADSFAPFMFLSVVMLLVIGIVGSLPFAKYAYLRYYAFNPELAREFMKESDQKDPETKALGLLILLSGLAVILPINPLNIIAGILMICQRSILMLPLTNILEIGFFAWVYVKWFRKYVRESIDRSDSDGKNIRENTRNLRSVSKFHETLKRRFRPSIFQMSSV